MSSLSEFVNEQRNKAGGSLRSSGLASGLGLGGMRPSFSMANIGTKIGTSFNGFFKTDGADDLEALTDTPTSSQNGQLPSSRNRRTNGWFSFASDEGVCGLNRFQRIAAFFLCLFAAMFCFASAMMLLPVLVIQTRKFAALNTLGSTFFITSFGFLLGPLAYVQFLFSVQRRLVTAVYLFTVLLTLYSSLWVSI